MAGRIITRPARSCRPLANTVASAIALIGIVVTASCAGVMAATQRRTGDKLRFYIDDTRSSGGVGVGAGGAGHDGGGGDACDAAIKALDVLGRLQLFIDVPRSRFVAARMLAAAAGGEGQKEQGGAAVVPCDEVVMEDADAAAAPAAAVRSAARALGAGPGDKTCALDVQCVDVGPAFGWTGNAYNCDQIDSLLATAPLDMLQGMLGVESLEIRRDHVVINPFNATGGLDSLPPPESIASQPVRFDPNRFWICVLGDSIVAPPNVPPQRVQVAGGVVHENYAVGNVTTALAMHLRADPDVVDFVLERAPEFLDLHPFPPSPSADAPRSITFRILPNQSDYGSGNSSVSSSSASASASSPSAPSPSPAGVAAPPSGKHGGKQRHYKKPAASPTDAAATSITLLRASAEDVLFSTGYSCYPYNQSFEPTLNFSATNASVDFLPMYDFPVFVPSNLTDAAEVEAFLTQWWVRVIDPAQLRVVPVFVGERPDFFSPSHRLVVVTVAPVEARLNLTVTADGTPAVVGDFVDTVGSCLFAWITPAAPTSNFARDFTLAVMGAGSVGMLVVVVVAVAWGSVTPSAEGAADDDSQALLATSILHGASHHHH